MTLCNTVTRLPSQQCRVVAKGMNETTPCYLTGAGFKFGGFGSLAEKP